jgi:hypothetical protein
VTNLWLKVASSPARRGEYRFRIGLMVACFALALVAFYVIDSFVTVPPILPALVAIGAWFAIVTVYEHDRLVREQEHQK